MRAVWRKGCPQRRPNGRQQERRLAENSAPRAPENRRSICTRWDSAGAGTRQLISREILVTETAERSIEADDQQDRRPELAVLVHVDLHDVGSSQLAQLLC